MYDDTFAAILSQVFLRMQNVSFNPGWKQKQTILQIKYLGFFQAGWKEFYDECWEERHRGKEGGGGDGGEEGDRGEGGEREFGSDWSSSTSKRKFDRTKY